MNIEHTAQVVHAALRVYRTANQINNDTPWHGLTPAQREDLIVDVAHHAKNPGIDVDAMHNMKVEELEAAGWKHGDVLAPEKRERPDCCPFEQLPVVKQIELMLIYSTVRTCLGLRMSAGEQLVQVLPEDDTEEDAA